MWHSDSSLTKFISIEGRGVSQRRNNGVRNVTRRLDHFSSQLQEVRQVTVDRVQQRLAGLLTLDPCDLKQLIQLVLGRRDFLDDVQLLGVEDVQHVVKDGLQVTRVQTHLSKHSVFLLCGGSREAFVVIINLRLVKPLAKGHTHLLSSHKFCVLLLLVLVLLHIIY